MASHSPEPWEAVGAWIMQGTKWLAHFSDGSRPSTMDRDRENADRAVACVNAMKGVPDPEKFMETVRAAGSVADTLTPRDGYDLKLFNDPRWEERGMVHDWRNYVPEIVMDLWDDLSPETRAVCYQMAVVQALAEEWD